MLDVKRSRWMEDGDGDRCGPDRIDNGVQLGDVKYDTGIRSYYHDYWCTSR